MLVLLDLPTSRKVPSNRLFPTPQKPVTRAQALDRLFTVTENLIALFGECAVVQQGEMEAKSNTWTSTQQESITARDRWATHAALNFTTELVDIRLSISALEAERDFLTQYLLYADD